MPALDAGQRINRQHEPGDFMSKPTSPDMPAASTNNPGDQAAPGTEQTGENTCPVCGGSGRMPDQAKCSNCGGSGIVIETVGDA
jgi:DnaJ-class molecular chaperone